MPYTFFLYFTGFFVCVGLLLGVVLLLVAFRHRVALRSLLLPLDPREHYALLHPVELPPRQDDKPD